MRFFCSNGIGTSGQYMAVGDDTRHRQKRRSLPGLEVI